MVCCKEIYKKNVKQKFKFVTRNRQILKKKYLDIRYINLYLKIPNTCDIFEKIPSTFLTFSYRILDI